MNNKEQDMDILQQCQKWHENDEYQKIIDALEAVPSQERTPEMDSELARAYNNLAEPGDRELLKKAIDLLKPHEEYFAGDHFWNYRMGYSYYYLDQEGRALRYFEKALEARPGDEDTLEFIHWCEKGIAQPQFSQCFRERTESAWEKFAGQEKELRRIMDQDKDNEQGEELLNQCEAILNLAFDDISFEMGFNGEKYELILTPEGDKVRLFELVYFRKHAPKEVLEHWNILVGRQPIRNIGLRTDDGWDISGEEVQIWLEEQGENSFVISAYCEKLLPMVREKEGRAWWMLTTLTDQVLGEIPHMRYIDSFDVLEEPKAEPSICMSQLPDKLREKGLELSTDPEAFLKSYIGYQMKPNEDPDADWRLDVIAGSTCCAPLVNGYLNDYDDFMDDLHADGAVAGFFCYPLDTLREEKGSQKIFDFRDNLEEALTAGDSPEVLTLTGGATGIYCGYVDFIAWDIRTALKMAKAFFEDSDLPWASFHTFRREAGSVSLKKAQDSEPDTEKQEDGDDGIEMDDAAWHMESIEEKELDIDPVNAYNHMAIYLRWCLGHNLMGEDFLKEYGEVVKQVKADPASTDLRVFIQDELDGCLFSAIFNQQGRAFAEYYYGENDAPQYPADIDNYALEYFGPSRYHSNEFRQEAYLFIPFDEDYYQAMAKVIEEHFENWKKQDFGKDTLEPSDTARVIMEYLDCACTYFPSMADDDPIMSAYSYARRLGVREGFIPVLVRPDKALLECLVMNADPENQADCYEFDLKTVAEYRKKLLAAPVKDGKAILEDLTGQRKEEAQEDDMDWQEEILGEMEDGYVNHRFASYWDSETDMTCPLILAKIPVKNPWEIFAYLPFGNWNECPDTRSLMAIGKYWFEQYGAVPAVMSHDELEFTLPAAVPKEKVMEAAVEQYGFCPDMDQNFDKLGALADTLRQSTVWYFWWD